MIEHLQVFTNSKTAILAFKAGCLVAALAAASTAGAAGPKPRTELERIFYDIGVIGYCALSCDEATRGFNRQLKALVDNEKIDSIQIRDARNHALTMVEWEWDNRGLGGFRGWCSGEGEAALRRFME